MKYFEKFRVQTSVCFRRASLEGKHTLCVNSEPKAKSFKTFAHLFINKSDKNVEQAVSLFISPATKLSCAAGLKQANSLFYLFEKVMVVIEREKNESVKHF